MSRIVVALLGLAAFGVMSPALAQRRELTLFGGGTLTWATGNNIDRGQAHPGFVGGFGLRFPQTRSISIETGVLVTQHRLFGQRAPSTQPPLETGLLADAANLVYLEVPVLLRSSGYSKSQPIRPFLLLGPYIGVRIGCRREVTEPNGRQHTTDCSIAGGSFGSESVLPAVYQELDIGLLGGIGVEIRQFALALRVQRSLRNLVETPTGVHASPFDDARLWTAMLSVEYVIRVL